MINFVGSSRRVLALSTAQTLVLDVGRELPADGLLILIESDPGRAGAARRLLSDAGIDGRASVIIGEPARILYKIAGPFDLILSNADIPPADPLRASLDRLLAPGGRLSTPARLAFDAIRARNEAVNAFITVFDNADREQLPSDGPLRGLPISIKDLIDVAGSPTTAASRVRKDHVAAKDATVVERLKQAGAVINGKTNLHEFALGVTNDESAFGPCRNPHNLSRSPGGSSGGSAAAVAAGMSWASIGTDTGGSIRIPAAACGVVGLKPATAEIPTTGVFPLSVSLDHVGPIARSVLDAWTVYEVLKGSAESPKVPTPLSKVRLGRLTGYFLEKLDPMVLRRYDEALGRLVSAGAALVDVQVPHAADIPFTYSRIVLPEAYAVHAKTLAERYADYTADVASRLASGRDVPREQYEQAQSSRATLRNEVDAALTRCDAIVLPTLPIPAPTIGQSTVVLKGVEENVRALMLRLTQLFNLSGHPAITIPCGTTTEGLPCGFQIVGKRDGTADLLGISLGCEAYLSPGARARADRRDP